MNKTLRFASFPLPAPPPDGADTSPTVIDSPAAKRRPPRLARGTQAETRCLEGAVLGRRYEVRSVVGAGSWGTVYEGRDQRTGETVAIKVASRLLTRSAGGSARFSRESMATLHIDHPGIVQVLDAGVCDDGTQYMVMEFLDGRDLADVLEREGRPSTARALEIAALVADALAAAHRAGVVHRDLKPGNVHLSRTGRIKVIDFGISKQRRTAPSHELTSPGSVLGSPAYMAPEQARGCPNIDGRADVYALGAMLYELLAGNPPFTGATFVEIVEQHFHVAPPPPSARAPERRLPAAVDQIVLRCLAKQPDERFASMDELFDALVRALALLDGAVAARVARRGGALHGRRRAGRSVGERRARRGGRRQRPPAGAVRRAGWLRLGGWLAAGASAVAAGWLAAAHFGPW